MRTINRKIALTLLSGIFSLGCGTVYAGRAEGKPEAATKSDGVAANEYIYGIDSYDYTDKKIPGVFLVGDAPKGYEPGVIGYKIKDSAKAKEWHDKFWTFVGDILMKAVREGVPVPADKIKELDDFSATVLDKEQIKVFSAVSPSETMAKEGYGCFFEGFYALIAKDDPRRFITPAWLLDPNAAALAKDGIDTKNLVLFRWKNPDYEALENNREGGENSTSATDGDVAVLPTTETFTFEGSDFKQAFQVVANPAEVSANPEGLKKISEEVVRLFNDMPKVGATIIGRMVTGKTIAVCPIVTQISDKPFRAALIFDPNTTAEQAEALADKLEAKFEILKKRVLDSLRGEIDAETKKRLEELRQKLQEQEELAAAAAKAKAINVDQATTSGDDRVAVGDSGAVANGALDGTAAPQPAVGDNGGVVVAAAPDGDAQHDGGAGDSAPRAVTATLDRQPGANMGTEGAPQEGMIGASPLVSGGAGAASSPSLSSVSAGGTPTDASLLTGVEELRQDVLAARKAVDGQAPTLPGRNETPSTLPASKSSAVSSVSPSSVKENDSVARTGGDSGNSYGDADSDSESAPEEASDDAGVAAEPVISRSPSNSPSPAALSPRSSVSAN